MTPTWPLDDKTVDAIVRGDDVDPHFEPLAAFARQVRALGDEPAPPASPALRALITGGGGPGHRERHTPRVLAVRTTNGTHGAAGRRLAAKVGLGVALAITGTAGTAAAGVLPEPADDAVRAAIEAVTPVEFTDPADEHPASFGERVSNDATGQSDGDKGVDGDDISDQAPGAAHRRTDPGENPGEPATSGLDRATETPAAPHLPDDVPAADGTEPKGPPTVAPPGPASAPSTVPDSGDASGEH